MKRRQDDYLRNCRQINFVVLNGFCLLSKPPPDLLFLFVICFYISRYHFSRILRTSFNNIWIKYFRHKFSFFNGFTQPPFHPLNSQNPLCVTKNFCRCSLNARIWKLVSRPADDSKPALGKDVSGTVDFDAMEEYFIIDLLG